MRYAPALLALLLGCGNDQCGTVAGVGQITVFQAFDEIQAHQGDPDFVILDVRTAAEYAQGHLEDAVNIDFLDPDFATDVDPLPRSRTYLVYCQAGGRSAQAADLMLSMGFASLLDVAGGFSAWDNAGLPWTTN